jgi:hypothetical protein
MPGPCTNTRRPPTPIQPFDPFFRDLVLFYECFHGDTGRGVGASHQTGWTALVAKLVEDLGWKRSTA